MASDSIGVGYDSTSVIVISNRFAMNVECRDLYFSIFVDIGCISLGG